MSYLYTENLNLHKNIFHTKKGSLWPLWLALNDLLASPIHYTTRKTPLLGMGGGGQYQDRKAAKKAAKFGGLGKSAYISNADPEPVEFPLFRY